MTNSRLTEIPVVIAPQAEATRCSSGSAASPQEDRRAIGADLATVQVGWPIGMPLCRALGGGLWEARSALPSRRIARLIFFVAGD